MTTKNRKISFRELYAEHNSKPTPLQEFIEEVARVTDSSPVTVRLWKSGRQTPELIKQRAIANHFGIDIESLFPKS